MGFLSPLTQSRSSPILSEKWVRRQLWQRDRKLAPTGAAQPRMGQLCPRADEEQVHKRTPRHMMCRCGGSRRSGKNRSLTMLKHLPVILVLLRKPEYNIGKKENHS